MAVRLNKRSGEVFLYGIVGNAGQYQESFTALEVSEALEKLDGKRALVRINSPGGNVDEGLAIFNQLLRYRGGCDTSNDGVVASIATVIYLAGTKRIASEGSLFMIHDAWAFGSGSSTELRKLADVAQKHNESLVQVYRKYLNRSESQIRALMAQETWFDEREAIEVGLSTTLASSKATPIAVEAKWFRRMPSALKRPARSDAWHFRAVAAKAKNGC